MKLEFTRFPGRPGQHLACSPDESPGVYAPLLLDELGKTHPEDGPSVPGSNSTPVDFQTQMVLCELVRPLMRAVSDLRSILSGGRGSLPDHSVAFVLANY